MLDQLPIRNAEKVQDHTIFVAMDCKANKHEGAILVWRFSSLLEVESFLGSSQSNIWEEMLTDELDWVGLDKYNILWQATY
jgi:hypothetical protein